MRIYDPEDEKLPIVEECKEGEWDDEDWTPCDQIFS